MKMKTFFIALAAVGILFNSGKLFGEDLEHLFTVTAAYNGNGSLSGASAYTMPDEDGTYSGYIWFPEGFTIYSGRTATLNVFPPVGGTIDLNDGTLSLTGDLILRGTAEIVNNAGTSGVINGNGNVIKLLNDMTIDDAIVFGETGKEGDTIIDGDNNVITLGSNGKFTVANNRSLTLKNLILKDLSGTGGSKKIVLNNASSELILDNVTIWLDDDFDFDQGVLTIQNDVVISGSRYGFGYNSSAQSTISKQSQLLIDHGVTFSYEPSNRTRLTMEDNTSHLYLNGCRVHADGTGLLLTKGTVIFDSLVTLHADGASAATAISLGDSGGDDITTVVLPGANIEIYGYIDMR